MREAVQREPEDSCVGAWAAPRATGRMRQPGGKRTQRRPIETSPEEMGLSGGACRSLELLSSDPNFFF